MAVPVLSELQALLLDIERRRVRPSDARSAAQAGSAKSRTSPGSRRAIFRSRAPASRPADDELGSALRRNLEIHRRQLLKSATLLRSKQLSDRILRDKQKLVTAGAQLARCFNAYLSFRRRDTLAAGRMLETTSYRGILSRGFALVRGEDGSLRRNARDIKQNEKLILTFGDGDRAAIAADAGKVQNAPANAKKPSA